MLDYSSVGSFSLSNLTRISLADDEGTEITVNCSDNITGPGSTVFRECAECCPKTEGTFGPTNGSCTYYIPPCD